jgi:hypothetical protein
MEKITEVVVSIAGGMFGWYVGNFHPTFPLVLIAIAFILYDSWTAYELDKRVKRRYPDKKCRPAKFVSYKFWGVIPTMVESFVIILLMFAAQKWVFIDLYVTLSYIATGAICGVQLLSIAENKCSCRQPGDNGYKIWKVMAKVLVDKTERHFDVNLKDLKEDFDKETNIEN